MVGGIKSGGFWWTLTDHVPYHSAHLPNGLESLQSILSSHIYTPITAFLIDSIIRVIHCFCLASVCSAYVKELGHTSARNRYTY